MSKLKYLLVLFLLVASESFAKKISLFCETGDPGGTGPIAYIDLEQRGSAVAVVLQLNINSIDPQFRRPNVSINRNYIMPVLKTMGWQFVLSNVYQLQLVKNSNDKYWTARVDSRKSKFESIYLSCQ